MWVRGSAGVVCGYVVVQVCVGMWLCRCGVGVYGRAGEGQILFFPFCSGIADFSRSSSISQNLPLFPDSTSRFSSGEWFPPFYRCYTLELELFTPPPHSAVVMLSVTWDKISNEITFVVVVFLLS